MKLRPLSNYVVIRPVEREKMTEGGIHIPDTANNENCQRGEVVDTGPGRMVEGVLTPPRVKAGDRVIYMNMAITSVSIEGETLFVSPSTAIIAVIEG